MSSFVIAIIAFMTRPDFSGSGSLNNSLSTVGTICQDKPNLSFSHPHWTGAPPADSFSQYASTSSCV